MNKWRWSLMLWREDEQIFVQIARFDADANREVLCTVTDTDGKSAVSRARKLAKLNCAMKSEAWAKVSTRKMLNALS